MIPNLREENFTTKQEGKTIDDKNSKVSTPPSTPVTSWSRLRDPRIVRVSRALGGKDRHSKVCTVRGLRDRRIRLSVPTAIQLYDLQDRLGLNQPSKVVDWLLNVAKKEIDKLPPLQIPPGSFILDHHQQTLMRHDQAGASSQSNKLDELKVTGNIASWDDSLGVPNPNFWNLGSTLSDRSKEIATETGEGEDDQKEGEDVSSINFFPRSNHTSLLNNPNVYNSFYRLDPSNFTIPQMGRDDLHNFNVVPLPSTTLPQVLVYPPYFPSHVGTSLECDPKQINHFQMLGSSSTSENPSSNSPSAASFYSLGQAMRPLHLSMGSNLYGSEHRGGSQSNNNGEFPST